MTSPPPHILSQEAGESAPPARGGKATSLEGGCYLFTLLCREVRCPLPLGETGLGVSNQGRSSGEDVDGSPLTGSPYRAGRLVAPQNTCRAGAQFSTQGLRG